MDLTSIRSQESHGSSASTSMTSHESSHSNDILPWDEDGAQIVLVLVGLIASGKSTFAKALEETSPSFADVTRMILETERLSSGSCEQVSGKVFPCVSTGQISTKHNGLTGLILPMNSLARDYGVSFICKERLQHRTNHPTIHSAEEGIRTLYRFQKMFVSPSADEGFERIFNIKPEDHPLVVYSRDELQTLLSQVAAAPPPMRSAPQPGIREYFDAVLPHGAGRKGGWRERNHNNGHALSSHNNTFRRNAGRDGFGLRPRPSDPHNAVQSSSYNKWQSNSVSPQTDNRNPHGRVENVFQNDGRVGRADEQALPSISRDAIDRTMPSKQSGGGRVEFPILID